MLCLATPWHYLARQQGREASPIMQQANVLVWAAANTCCCSMWHPASWIWSERKVRLCHLVSWQHVGGYSFFPFESCSQNRSNTILGNSCHVAVCKGIFSFESIPHQAMAHKAKRMHGSLKCGWILTLLQWSSLTTLSVRKCCSGVCPHQASPRQPLQMHHGYSLVCRKIPMCPLAITACLFHVLRKLYFPKLRWQWLNPNSRSLCVRMHVNTCKTVRQFSFILFAWHSFIFNYFNPTAIDQSLSLVIRSCPWSIPQM